MKNYKKTFWGSIVAFFIGTSCCWMSSLAVWLGGAAILGTISSFVENIQEIIITAGGMLLLLTLYLFVRK